MGEKKSYLYVEPRDGVIYTERPERRNVYRIEATEENQEQLAKLTGAQLVAWLGANEVPEEQPPFEDRDWAHLREAHDELNEKLENCEALNEALETDVDARDEFIDDVRALVLLVGKLVL